MTLCRFQAYRLRPQTTKKEAKKSPQQAGFLNFGSPTRTRTTDPLINSQLLYQLSYRGKVGTLKCRPGFWFRGGLKSSHNHAFYAIDRFFQHFHRTSEGQAHISGRSERCSWYAGDVGIVDQALDQFSIAGEI